MGPKTKFSEGEKVMCFHGPLIYEAKCHKVEVKDKQVKYFIHYSGWNKNWDEWVPETRVLKLNDYNATKQKDLQKAHDSQNKNKKIVLKKIVQPDKKKQDGSVGGDSRSSTPNSERGERVSVKKEEDMEPKAKKSRLDATVESEQSFMYSLEVKIKLPDEIKPVLVDDWDLINRQRKLPVLPARVCVDDILEAYVKSKSNVKSSNQQKQKAVKEVVDGLREYFNVMIGTQLLYKFERPQYAEILKANPERSLSQVYGFIHLARLFVRLGHMLAYTQLDEKGISLLNYHLHDFLKYVSKNLENFFSIQDYGIAPPEYQRKAY